MCKLKFGYNKRVKYIKGLARCWLLLLEVLPCPGVVPEKWTNYTLQINLRGFSGRYMTVARQRRNGTCEREAKRYGIKWENDEKKESEREKNRETDRLRSEKRDKRVMRRARVGGLHCTPRQILLDNGKGWFGTRECILH